MQLIAAKNVEHLSLSDLKSGFDNPCPKNVLCRETIAMFSIIPPFSYEIPPVCICRLFSVRLEMVYAEQIDGIASRSRSLRP